jgi:hypothetical protein
VPKIDFSSLGMIVNQRVGSSPTGFVVVLLAAVAGVLLIAIGILARAAATGAESTFNILAWLIPSLGVGFSLVLALVGTFIIRRMMKGQASSAGPEETAEADKETATVGTQDVAAQATDEEDQDVIRFQDQQGNTLAILRRVQDEQGHTVAILKTDAEGNVVNRVDRVYDSQGNLLAERNVPEPIIDKEQGEEPIVFHSWEDYREFMDDIRRSREGAEQAAETGFPIEGYDEMNVAEVSERLNNLSAEELQLVRDYEERHKRRKSLLEQLDRKIRAT